MKNLNTQKYKREQIKYIPVLTHTERRPSMLIWEDNRPFFAVHRQRGSRIWLSFVLDYVDDVPVKEENFFVCLQQDPTAWRAALDKNRSDGIVHKSMINRLIEMINNAVTTKSNLDFIVYVKMNKSSNAYFTYTLTEPEDGKL